MARAGDTVVRRSAPRARTAFAFALCVAALLADASCASNLDARRAASGDGHGEAASCVGPVLGTTRDPRPLGPASSPQLGNVARGQSVTVYGAWYFAGPCQDTAAAGEAVPSAAPEETVDLTLRAADGATFHLASVHPDKSASFAATFEIPTTAATGPADITDNRGHHVRVVISGT